jgi:hypothetical protein
MIVSKAASEQLEPLLIPVIAVPREKSQRAFPQV